MAFITSLMPMPIGVGAPLHCPRPMSPDFRSIPIARTDDPSVADGGSGHSAIKEVDALMLRSGASGLHFHQWHCN